jgi:type III pantothenate kinase
MILLADLGNTRLKLAHCDGKAPVGSVQALAWHEPDFVEHLEYALRDFRGVRAVWAVSSTPAERSDPVLGRLSRLAPLQRARSSDSMPGLELAYPEPGRLGVDRYLALVAARARGVEAGLVVLVGTAMTLDALAPGGRHLGGLILPSPARMRAALARDAPHLPREGGRLVPLADNSADAVHSGSLLAAAALVERSRAGLDPHSTPRLLVSGGGAADLLPALAADAEHCESLVLEGLACWGRQHAATLPR